MKLVSSCLPPSADPRLPLTGVPRYLLALSLASFVFACSSQRAGDELGSDQANIEGSDRANIEGSAPAPGTCAAAGGTCVGLSPSSCQSGHWADATVASCGGGVGVGCCVVDEVVCPVLSPPAPGFCDGGTVTVRKNADGCNAGFDCKLPPPPPPANSCEAIGGACVGLSPSSCPSGRWADASQGSCGSGVGVGCCLPPCPAMAAPPPGFCPDGTVTPRKNATGCVVGFDCVPTATNACESAGGQCVGIAPSSCANGSWSSLSCGGGIGVGCCIQ